MLCLGLTSTAVHLYIACLTPVTGLRCHVHAHGEILQPQKCMPTAKAPTAAYVLNSALSPVTGLHHWVHLQLAPQLCICTLMAQFLSPASTAVSTPMAKPCSHSDYNDNDSQSPDRCQCTLSWPLPLLLTLTQTISVCLQLAPNTIKVPAAGRPQLSVCIPLAPATTAACLDPSHWT